MTASSDCEPPLTRAERLRRVIRLCCGFTRNYAYYTAAMERLELWRHSDFWVTTSGNFIDLGLLDWCKLFVDGKWDRKTKTFIPGEHHWKTILGDPLWFETHLFCYAETDAESFATMIKAVRRYRNAFLAHLDSDRTMFIPELETALRAVCFYHRQVLADPAALGRVNDLSQDQRRYFNDCLLEARQIYGRFR